MKDALLGLAAFLAVFSLGGLLLAWLGWGPLTNDVAIMGDMAADMLLVNQIRDEGVLLVGHYSRFQFNHPGPFWLYYNHAFELLLKDRELNRAQIWSVGQVFLAALLIAFTACGLSSLLIGRIRLAPSLLAAILLICFAGYVLVGLWMPYRLVAPYGAFLVCCMLIAQGCLMLVPIGTLLACMLIHGYATMPFFCLPFLGLAICMGYLQRRTRGHIHRIHFYRTITVSLGLAVLVFMVFALPIVYDALFFKTGNLQKMFDMQRSFASATHPSWTDMLQFLRALMPPAPFGWLLAGALVAFVFRPINRKLLQMIGLLTAVCLLLVIYYKNTPAPLYPFVGQFFSIAPILLLAGLLVCLIGVSYKHFGNTRRLTDVITLLAGAGIAFMLAPAQRLPIASGPVHNEPGIFAAFIANDLKDGEIAAVDYAEHSTWPFMAGLLLELDKLRIPACTTWQHMGFLYTERAICHADTMPRYNVTELTDRNLEYCFRGNQYGLQRVR